MTTWVQEIVRASRGTAEQAGQGLDLGQSMEGGEDSAGERTGTLIDTIIRSVAEDRSRLETGGRWVDWQQRPYLTWQMQEAIMMMSMM